MILRKLENFSVKYPERITRPFFRGECGGSSKAGLVVNSQNAFAGSAEGPANRGGCNQPDKSVN